MAQNLQFNVGLSRDDAAVVLTMARDEQRPAAAVLRRLILQALAAKQEQPEA